MNREEFKQKMTVIKEKMQVIFKELHNHDAYIYHAEYYVNLDNKLRKQLDKITYIIEKCDAFNTTESFHDMKYKEYSGYLELFTNMWTDLKPCKWINGKVIQENGEEFYVHLY